MKQTKKQLGDAELEIMQSIWRMEGPVSSSQVQLALRGKRDWALATLMTALDRLCNKGFLHREKQGRNNLYTALISQETYQQWEGQTMLERVYGNSVTGLVASLYEGRSITDEDMEQLRQFLDDWKESRS